MFTISRNNIHRFHRFHRYYSLAFFICATCVICGSAVSELVAQTKPGPRGNVPGEWRAWGADLWSSRYSPLDQINARNFNSLKPAWQWNAGEFGMDCHLWIDPELLSVSDARNPWEK